MKEALTKEPASALFLESRRMEESCGSDPRSIPNLLVTLKMRAKHD